MARVKRYKCNISNFAFPIVIGGKQRWLRFLGAKSNEGYYTTADAEEQRQIESSKRYKRGELRIVGSYEIADEVAESSDEDTHGATTVEAFIVEVSTVQAAREWLIEHKGAKASELPNKDALLAYAKDKGVEFVGI